MENNTFNRDGTNLLISSFEYTVMIYEGGK